MDTFTRPDIIDLIGPDFDHAPQSRAQKTLIICSAPRTGSHELSRFLTAAGVGVPHEYFNPNYAQRLATRWGLAGNVLAPELIESYIDALYRRRMAGDVFAAKIQFNQFTSWLQNSAGAALFEGAVVIHLFRPDIAAQVSSFQAAMDTGLWDYSPRQTTAPRPPGGESRLTRALADIDAIVGEDAGFRRLFARLDIRPHFLTTEDLFAQPRATIERIAAALGVTVDSDKLERAIAASAPYKHPVSREGASDTIAVNFKELARHDRPPFPFKPSAIFTQSSQPETLRSFWHGSSLGAYQLLGLRSFVDCGHRVELFTYDSGIAVPDWIVRRDANEIWPTDHVLSYQSDLGRGSFALHANLFRYAMLHKLGGWWIDLDVVLLRPELPQNEIYFAIEKLDPIRATFSVLKFPPGHPALAEAVERCVALGEASSPFGETGVDLFTELVGKHGLARFGQPMEMTFPISALDVPALFNPEQCDELQNRCVGSYFVHLFNETWRRAGIPRYLGPPEGSFIDYLLRKHGFDVSLPRMEFADLKRWTAYLTLHEEYQAGLRAYKVSNEALQARLHACEQDRLIDRAAVEAINASRTNGELIMSNDSEDRTQKRIRDLESRTEQLTEQVNSLARAYSRARHQSRRLWLRPPLWTFEQYKPKKISINPNYQNQELPSDPISIAIVTPTFNQGTYLPATIDSVLTQNYPRLNYLVQDGASTDGTTDVLRAYGPQLAWQSGRDDGQAQAINRAFSTCDGDIMAYLNSDDMYLPGTLAYVAGVFQSRPDVDIVYGHRIFVDRDGLEIGRAVLPRHDAKTLDWADYIPQETMFWRRRVWTEVGPIDESFQYALDWDFILKAQHAGFRFLRLPRFLACFRVHDKQKTSLNYDKGREEMQRLRCRYLAHEPSHLEINKNVAPYLMRQLAVHWMYRCGILRY